jgi:hypothetical protein
VIRSTVTSKFDEKESIHDQYKTLSTNQNLQRMNQPPVEKMSGMKKLHHILSFGKSPGEIKSPQFGDISAEKNTFMSSIQKQIMSETKLSTNSQSDLEFDKFHSKYCLFGRTRKVQQYYMKKIIIYGV